MEIDRSGFWRVLHTYRSTANFPLVLPTAAAVERLRSLFPSNPRLDLYLGALGDVRGTAAPFDLPLGVSPQTGMDRGSVQFATAPLALPLSDEGPQWLVRLDHNGSEAHRLSWRYIYGSRLNSPWNVYFPGFTLYLPSRHQNFLFTDSYTFGPSYTNEFRFSYGRHGDDRLISPQSVPLAHTLPRIGIQTVASPGVENILTFRHANNLLFQETQTKLTWRHIFRYGAELLRQLATQNPNAYPVAEIQYQGSAGFSALANFLDDFSGSGRIRKTFGTDIFHPDQFRQSYFFQDSWKATPSLTLTLGLRYENFGQVANVLRYPAFAGFDPDRFLEPNRVNRDNNNFGPAFGLAWSPSFSSGWLGKLFGDRKTVWRGGYQISYQALETQILSLELGASTPNAIFVEIIGERSGRGRPNWSAQLPSAGNLQPSLLDAQHGVIEKNFRSPYTERWSFGFQRQLPAATLLDVSYVGAGGHKRIEALETSVQTPDTFSPAGNMTTPRWSRTATLLPNSNVLFAGGISKYSPDKFVKGNCNCSVASAELNDPSTGTFTAAGVMTTTRLVTSATLLNSGKVLIADPCLAEISYY